MAPLEAPRRSLRARKTTNTAESDDSDIDDQHESKQQSPTHTRSRNNKSKTSKFVSDHDDVSEPDIDITAVVTESKTQHKRKLKPKQSSKEQKSLLDAPLSSDTATLSDDIHMGKLYKSIILSQTATKQITREWCDRYSNDATSDAAKCELMNLIIQICGSTSNVTMNQLLDNQIETLIRVCEESLRRPTSQDIQNQRLKRIESRMNDYWTKLIELMNSTNIIFNDDILYFIINIFTAISSSQIRDFRKIATLNASYVMDNLCELLNKLSLSIDTSRQQYIQAENVTKKQLAVDIGKTQKKYDYLLQAIKKCFDNIFVHRYRDVEPSIRIICLNKLQHWIRITEKLFLSDTYLKYLGWSLNDKNDLVRYTAIQCVNKLYTTNMTEQKQSKLNIFTNKFKSRINEMINDKYTKIVVVAIHTLVQLLSNNYLTESDCVDLPQLLFDKERDISVAASEFIYEDSFSEVSTDNKSYLQNKEDITQLLNIYEKFCPLYNQSRNNNLLSQDTYQSFEILVNNFYNKLQFFNNFQIYFDMLTESTTSKKKHQTSDNELSDHRITLILHLLYASTKHYMKSIDTDLSDTHENILIIIQHINTLLSQYQNENTKLTLLYQLMQLIQPEYYVTLRKKTELTNLLKLTKTIYMKHNNQVLLGQIAAFLRHYSIDTFQYATDVESICTSIYEQLNQQLLDQFDMEQHDTTGQIELLSVLKRFHGIYQAINNELFDYDRLTQYITDYKLDANSGESIEIYTYLLKIEFVNLRWNWQADATNLSELVHSMIDNYIDIFQSINQYEVLDLLYGHISDIFIMFSPASSTEINHNQYIVLQNHFTKYFGNLMSGKYITQRLKHSKQSIDQSTLLIQLHQYALRGAIKPVLFCIDTKSIQTKHFNLACQIATHYSKVCNCRDYVVKIIVPANIFHGVYMIISVGSRSG